MTPTSILTGILLVIVVAISAQLANVVGGKSDKTVKNQIKVLEQKLILENKIK